MALPPWFGHKCSVSKITKSLIHWHWALASPYSELKSPIPNKYNIGQVPIFSKLNNIPPLFTQNSETLHYTLHYKVL